MLCRFAGQYEFQACTHGGWAVYVGDLHIGTWETLEGARIAVKAPDFDDDEPNNNQ